MAAPQIPAMPGSPGNQFAVDLQCGAVIRDGGGGVADHVVRPSAPEQGFFERGRGDGVVQRSVGKVDHVLIAGGVIVGEVRSRLIPHHAVGAVALGVSQFAYSRNA
jgi:hypothetical protein